MGHRFAPPPTGRRLLPAGFAAIAGGLCASAIAQNAAPPQPPAASPPSTAPAAQPAPSPDAVPQSVPVTSFRPEPDWTLQVEPAMWYVAPGGKINLPDTGIGGDRLVLSELNTASPRLSPFAEVHLKADRARLTVSGFSLSAQGTSVAPVSGLIAGAPVAAGDELHSKLDFSSFEATGAYRILRFPASENECVRLGDGRLCFSAGLDAVAGVRYYETHFELTRTLGGRASASEAFAEPIVGAKVSAAFNEQFLLDLQITFGRFSSGHDRTSSSWDILVGGQWNPSHNLGVQLGYRSLGFDLKHGRGPNNFRQDGALQGLYGGLVIRF